MNTQLFGKSVRRVEDPAALQGISAFLDDLPDDDALHVAMIRSQVAHGRVISVDPHEALALPGVHRVVTASDLGPNNGPHRHPTWFPPTPALREAINPFVREEFVEVLASDIVRYVGAPVAAVIADDPYLAADAQEFVQLDVDSLEVVPDMDSALDPEAALLHPEWGDNISTRFRVTKGDVDQAWQRSVTIVSGTFTMGRQTGTPIEPRGVLAEYADSVLTVWSSTQAPHWLRNSLARVTGLPDEKIRVCAPFVGGGFGIKSMVYPEELLLGLLAIDMGAKLKWVETRSEHFLSAVHSRDQRHEISLAFDEEGKILGLRDHYLVDTGASNVEGLVVPYNTLAHLQGAYRVPALDVECVCVVTNKSPLSAYRGAGRPEAVFAMERILEKAARALDIDPRELRLRNLLDAAEMPYDVGVPYRDGSKLVLDAGDTAGCLIEATERVGYSGWRDQQAAALVEGRYLGLGMATYVEGTGIGPGEVAEIELMSSGDVEVRVALPSQGQGHTTVLAQICADHLQLPLDRITVRQGDTFLIAQGGGTIASRTVTVLGNSVDLAARELNRLLRVSAAETLEARPDDLELVDGRVSIRGARQRQVEIASLAATRRHLARETFEVPGVTFACGAHVAVVEVDPRSGLVSVLRYVTAHDCGRLVNPTIVEGQVVGGVAQGIGGALLEELVYDSDAQLLTGSFMTYLVPRATDLPDIEVIHAETPSARNPLGLKGVGEAGTIGPPAAIASAIDDALRPFSATVTRCPMTPTHISSLVDAADLATL